MKLKRSITSMLAVAALLLAPAELGAQEAQKEPQQSMTYADFMKKDELVVHQGHFTVYEANHKYYLEVPLLSLGHDILIASYVTRGYSSYVSDKSGIVCLNLAHEGTQLNVTVDRPAEEAADTSDTAMRRLIAQSAMKPADFVYPVVCKGKDDKSVIVDITTDLNSSTGLFDVSGFSLLSHPDPARSSVDGVAVVENGVVFTLTRTQTDTNSDPNSGRSADFTNMFNIEILIQQLPYSKDLELIADSPAYGFYTITNSDYDSRRYVATTHKYITRWRLDEPITVYIDPATPAPFRSCITKAAEQWTEAFASAGVKNPFRFTDDKKSAHMAYHTIMLQWSTAYSNVVPQVVTNNHTGEILCARMNVMDVCTSDYMDRYFVQCGAVDGRIRKNLNSIEVRKDMLTSLLAAGFGRILGLKPNAAAYTAVPLEKLHNAAYTAKWGTTGSVTAELAFNFVADKKDGMKSEGLLPRVSTYDYAAIEYAYGRKRKLPKDRRLLYSTEDKQDPSTSKTALSTDVYAAAVEGIEHVKTLYNNLEKAVKDLPAEQKDGDRIAKLGLNCLAQYQNHITDIAKIVGARSIRPIVDGVNNERTVYADRFNQQKALSFMEEELFTDDVPAWMKSEYMLRYGSYDISHMAEGLCNAVLSHFTDKETYRSLWHAEMLYGSKAMTCKEVFEWLDRVVFNNFKPDVAVTAYKQNVSLLFVEALSRAMASANITYGITNEGNNMLHSYFMHIYDNARDLSVTHSDAATRDGYRLMLMKMNREYFDKPIQ